jgi:lipopolysaccharide export system protein LptC
MNFFTRARYWLPLMPLVGLLGATYWLNQQVQPQTAKPDSSKRHDPDAIVDNFSATKLNEQGLPGFVMSSPKMLHYPDDDSTTIEAPRITILSAKYPAIHAVAKIGTISSKGEAIFLRDNVEVTRESSATQDELRLLTEYLQIIPDLNLASTDQAVTLANDHNTVHAIGMEMNSETRTLILLSQVRSEHVPAK